MKRLHPSEGPTPIQRLGFFGGPALAGLVLLMDLEPGRTEVTRTAAMLVLMAAWWITEALPIPVTALVPLVFLPVAGVLETDDVASYYFESITALFLGGFLLALAMERWGLHRRIALHILRLSGVAPSRLVLGFLLASAFLSMWISNSAAAMIMVPIALSVIGRVAAGAGAEDAAASRAERNVGAAILLAVAYGANVGGLATLVGTPPNMVLAQVFQQTFPDETPLSFGSWFLFGLPLSLLFQFLVWFLLARVLLPVPARAGAGGAGIIAGELERLGPMSPEERRVACVFVATALCWVFRRPIGLGAFEIPGWSLLLPAATRGLIDDGTVAVAAGILLFIIPAPSLRRARNRSGEETRAGGSTGLLDWPTARRLPWGVLLLFGGGFALAGAMRDSGLSRWVGDAFEPLSLLPVTLLVLGIALVVTFLTEVTSNTATTTVLLPMLAALAERTGHPPLLLMLPAALSASCAFMLPVATPPNAIVFASDRVPMREMVRAGVVLNVVGAVLVTLAVRFLAVPLLGL